MSGGKSAAERLREKNERIRQAQEQGNPSGAASARVRSKPVRITLDLPPATHQQLAQWCTDAAVDLGRARVPAVEVFRAFLDELADDEELANRIRARLEQ